MQTVLLTRTDGEKVSMSNMSYAFAETARPYVSGTRVEKGLFGKKTIPCFVEGAPVTRVYTLAGRHVDVKESVEKVDALMSQDKLEVTQG